MNARDASVNISVTKTYRNVGSSGRQEFPLVGYVPRRMASTGRL